jgi:hypothetical protein
MVTVPVSPPFLLLSAPRLLLVLGPASSASALLSLLVLVAAALYTLSLSPASSASMGPRQANRAAMVSSTNCSRHGC